MNAHASDRTANGSTAKPPARSNGQLEQPQKKLSATIMMAMSAQEKDGVGGATLPYLAGTA